MQWLWPVALIVIAVWFVRREISKMKASVDAAIARHQPWDKLGVTPDEVKQFRDGYQQAYNEISGVARKLAIADDEVAQAVCVHGLVAVLDQLRKEALEAERGKQSKQVVTAGEFVLVDAKGTARARLALEDGIRPILALLDETGTSSSYFVLTSTGPVLRLGHRGGEEIILAVGEYFVGDKPEPCVFINLADRDGFATTIGRGKLREEKTLTEALVSVAAASLLLSKDDEVLWSAP